MLRVQRILHTLRATAGPRQKRAVALSSCACVASRPLQPAWQQPFSPLVAGRAPQRCTACSVPRGAVSRSCTSSTAISPRLPLKSRDLHEFFAAYGPLQGPTRRTALLDLASWVESRLSGRPGAAADAHLRQDLFHRYTGVVGGLRHLVDLRADALALLRGGGAAAAAEGGGELHELRAFEQLLRHVLQRSFQLDALELQRVTWDSPASLIERMSRLEAVHRVTNLADMKRRLGAGRRCFCFVHPLMHGEPLAFVYVALMAGEATGIQQILEGSGAATAADAEADAEQGARSAIFYSITSAQRGLQGIPLGAFLIKRAMEHVKKELPNVKNFATLSPVPLFTEHVKVCIARARGQAAAGGTGQVDGADAPHLPSAVAGTVSISSEEADALQLAMDSFRVGPDLKPVCLKLCADYLLNVKKKSDRRQAFDPVARFHIGNGATLARINFAANTNPRGMRESLGLMVNYVYSDPDELRRNKDAYATHGIVAVSDQVRSLVVA